MTRNARCLRHALGTLPFAALRNGFGKRRTADTGEPVPEVLLPWPRHHAQRNSCRRYACASTCAALVLFGRTVVVTSADDFRRDRLSCRHRSPAKQLRPSRFRATGVGALFAVACSVIALLADTPAHNRPQDAAQLEAQLEELADRNWELREARRAGAQSPRGAGRSISSAAQMRADLRSPTPTMPSGALSGKARDDLDRHAPGCHGARSGPVHAAHTDGTRIHDQKIASGAGARWIAWREVAVRAETGRRDAEASAATSPSASRPSSARWKRAIRPRAPTAPSRASSPPWSATRSARRSTAFSAWPDLLLDTPLDARADAPTPKRRRPPAKRCCR